MVIFVPETRKEYLDSKKMENECCLMLEMLKHQTENPLGGRLSDFSAKALLDSVGNLELAN